VARVVDYNYQNRHQSAVISFINKGGEQACSERPLNVESRIKATCRKKHRSS